MATIITVAQRKGGAGKTTLACQLAAALAVNGKTVTGVDADIQGSFTVWGQLRAARDDVMPIEIRSATRFGLRTTIWSARKSADFVIVDTPPTIDRLVEKAVALADLVVTPLQLSPLDLDATIPTAALIGNAGKAPLFVANRAPPRARIADLIRRQIREQGLPLANTELGNRAAFSESLASGRGVAELSGALRARDEILALTSEVLSAVEERAAA